MVANGPESRNGPELSEDLMALWKMGEDLRIRGPSDAIMRPDREPATKYGGKDDRGRPVSKFMLGRLPAQKQVDDLAEVPLRYLHGQISCEASEAWQACETAPESLRGWGSTNWGRQGCVFRGSAFELLADFDDRAGAD